jgi:hypothetical protein
MEYVRKLPKYTQKNIKRGGKEQNIPNKQSTINIMTERSSYTLIIALNVNGLNLPIKKHRLAEWILKKKSQLYTVYKKLASEVRIHID